MNFFCYSNARGEIHYLTDSELREAGLEWTIMPRWTHMGEPSGAFVFYRPQKRFDILIALLDVVKPEKYR